MILLVVQLVALGRCDCLVDGRFCGAPAAQVRRRGISRFICHRHTIRGMDDPPW